MLKYGHCDILALDEDTVVITRYFNETDGLGRKREAAEKEVLTIKR